MPVSYFIHKEDAMKLDLKKRKGEKKPLRAHFGWIFKIPSLDFLSLLGIKREC